MMLIPEAWAGNPLMDEDRRAFYEYHAALMEPWDGPAAMCFSDGLHIGATLDRNGLRPARYLVTDDDEVIMASEAGVLPIPAEKIVAQVAPAAGQDAAHRPRSRAASSPTRRSRPSSPRAIPTSSGSPAPRSCSRTCRRCRTQRTRQRHSAARSPAGLRLHPGRPEAPADADGDDRPGSRRLDGHRHADLGALGQVQAALHLFQAELRPGHQPADRLDPRGTGDEPRLVHRAAAEHARPRGRRHAQAARSAPADPDQRGSREDPRHRRHGGQPVPLQDARHHLSGRARAPPAWRRRSTSCSPTPRWRSMRATTSSSCPTAR